MRATNDGTDAFEGPGAAPGDLINLPSMAGYDSIFKTEQGTDTVIVIRKCVPTGPKVGFGAGTECSPGGYKLVIEDGPVVKPSDYTFADFVF